MGARNSTSTRPRSFSSSDDGSASGALGLSAGMAMAGYLGGPSSSNGAARARASSIPGFGPGRHGHGVSIPTSNGGAHGAGSPDSDSSPDEGPFRGFRMMQASSLPPLGGLLIHGIKCPVCSKYVPPDDIECHLVMCLTKPRITYNEDVLQEDKGECVICLDDLVQGDTIARLPCLCIYHKSCIDAWFERNRSCPEHPQE